MLEHALLTISLIFTMALAIDNRRLRKLIAPFDHGKRDGKPGG